MNGHWFLAPVGTALVLAGCTHATTPVPDESARYVAVPIEASGELYPVDTRLGLTWRLVQCDFPDRSVAAWVQVERMTEKAWIDLASGAAPKGAVQPASSAPIRFALPSPIRPVRRRAALSCRLHDRCATVVRSFI